MNMQEILSQVIVRTNEIFEAEAGSVSLLESSGQTLVIRAAVGAGADAVRGLSLPVSQGVIGWVVSHEKPALIPDVRQDGRFLKDFDEQSGFQTRSIMCVPLRVNGRTIGAIELMNMRSDYLSDTGLNILSVIADHAALAIEHARLFNDMRTAEANRRELEQKLQQTEKLSAMGKLVAGVAHELNNPLTSIMGYADLLQQSSLSTTQKADLEMIVRQSQRAQRIIRDLLTFARRFELKPRLVDLNEVISDSLLLMKPQLETGQVQVKKALDFSLPPIMADPNLLEQVFINLITNAIHALAAMPQPRQLTIKSQPMGPRLRLSFADNGPGIPENIINRIFDPFYSTKQVGEGTGLGLSICFGIISQHQGRIWAENSPAGGAIFYIELPLELSVGQPAITPAAELPKLVPSPAGSAILVVDDEITLLKLLERVLIPAGYAVETVADGQTALQKLQARSFDLVVCDILMPDILGTELYRQAVDAWPYLADRFIFITGNVIEPEIRTFLKNSNLPWLSKPFLPSDIEKLIVKLTAKIKS
jgi:two-component system NtrC family sensor kinase